MPTSLKTPSSNQAEQKSRSFLEDTLSAPLPWEVDYADKAYWAAHFAEEINVIKEGLLKGMTPQTLSERLFELQGIIGKNTLAIWVYQQGIRKLQALLKSDTTLQSQYGATLAELLKTFKNELKEQPAFTLENFQAELEDLLPKLRQGEIDAELFLKVIRSYREILSDAFYQKIDLLLNPTFIRHYFKVNYDDKGIQVINFLSTEHYYLLYDRLDQSFAEEAQRLGLVPSVSEETPSEVSSENTAPIATSSDPQSNDAKTSYFYLSQLFNQAVSAVKGAVHYTLNNPKKVITTGLMLQATAAAALEGMGLTNRKPIPSTLLSKDVNNRLENPLARVSEAASIDLAMRPKSSHSALEKTTRKEISVSIVNQKRTFSPRIKRAVGDEFQINTYTTSNQQYPAVTALSNGTTLVTWESNGQDGDVWGIYAQIVDATGSKVGSEFQVNTYTTNDQRFPAIAALGNGTTLVTWTSVGQDGDGYGIYGQVVDASGNKVGNEFQVNTYTTNSQLFPAVTALSNGNALVTWMSNGQDGDSYGIYGQIVGAVGSKVGSEFQVNTYTTSVQAYPAVTALSNGNALVTWMSGGQDGDSYGIYGQIVDAVGSKVGSEFQVNTYTSNSQENPAVIALSNSHALVMWQSYGQDGNGWGIYGQVVDASGNKVGNEFQVNTYTTNSQLLPAVTALSNGNALVTWYSTDQDGFGFGVYGQIVDAMSRKVGKEFPVNTYTTSHQDNPAVTTLSNGNVFITWDGSQDSDGFGIYGKIIDTHLTAMNTNQVINYLENMPQDLANIIITPPVFIANVTASLTLSNPLVGSLTTGTSGNVTSTYTSNTGIWQVSGNVPDVNTLLANVQFQPAPGFNSNFTISVTVDDGFNLPLNDTINLVGHPTPSLTTTHSITTNNPMTSNAILTTSLEPNHSSDDTHSKTNIGSIVGGIVGGLAVLATSLGIFAVACKRSSPLPQSPADLPKLEEEDRPSTTREVEMNQLS